jgi:toxin ParE1/3/4
VRVRFTPTGRVQFLAAIAFIRRENPVAAARFRQRAEQALRRLEQFPESGRVVPEFPDLPYREVIVPPYRFFYRNPMSAGEAPLRLDVGDRATDHPRRCGGL